MDFHNTSLVGLSRLIEPGYFIHPADFVLSWR